MESCEVIPAPEDTTQAGALWELVVRFCSHIHAPSMEEVLSGGLKPYRSDDGRTYFRMAGIADYMKRHQFREERGEIGRVLKQHGGEHHADNVTQGGRRTTRNYWSVPSPAAPGGLDVPADVRNPVF